MTSPTDETTPPQEEGLDLTNTHTLTFRVSTELTEKLSGSAARVRMNRSVMARLALDRGIDAVMEALDTKGGEA